MSSRRQPAIPDLAGLARGIRARERAAIARAITLIESRRADHQKAARRLVQELLPLTGKAIRVGITGAPAGAKPPPSGGPAPTHPAKAPGVAALAAGRPPPRGGGASRAEKT